MTYKAKSITSKASSAVKMNMALVEGNREVGAVRKAGAADFIAGMGLGDKKEKKKVEAVEADTTDTTDTTDAVDPTDTTGTTDATETTDI